MIYHQPGSFFITRHDFHPVRRLQEQRGCGPRELYRGFGRCVVGLLTSGLRRYEPPRSGNPWKISVVYRKIGTGNPETPFKWMVKTMGFRLRFPLNQCWKILGNSGGRCWNILENAGKCSATVGKCPEKYCQTSPSYCFRCQNSTQDSGLLRDYTNI